MSKAIVNRQPYQNSLHHAANPYLSPAQGNQTTPSQPVQQPPSIDKDDRMLPSANITRIMERVHHNLRISREAKFMMQEFIAEFIGYVTSEAADRLMEDKRKTISGDDVLDSMRALGFTEYISQLEHFLYMYRHTAAEEVVPPSNKKPRL